ncbi:MAG: flavin reductase [Chloroflexota bacterium]
MDVKALHLITYGIYVIGSRDGEKLNAQVANTVIQVCAEPAAVGVAINRNNFSHGLIKASRCYSVSILAEDTPLSFIGGLGFRSGREVDKLKDVNYRIGVTGAPVVLDNALAYLEARVISEMDVRTHTIFVGDVVEARLLKEGKPMTYAYYHQVKRGTTPRTAPSYVEEKKPVVQMAKYKCNVCGYIYDPELGDPEGNVPPGTPFEKLPDGWTCPVCGAGKEEFQRV